MPARAGTASVPDLPLRVPPPLVSQYRTTTGTRAAGSGATAYPAPEMQRDVEPAASKPLVISKEHGPARGALPAPATIPVADEPRRVPIARLAAGLGLIVAIAAWFAARTSPDVNAWGALATGLTTGGLSCLAVQGGLLASAVAGQPSARKNPPAAATIGWFLAAKLITYTGFGAMLGYFGSVVQMSFATRGWLQVAIGVFMLATALRMVWPHPWLRFLALEPPASVRRGIRRLARNNDSAATPVFLGALTVLIPCGVTQAMMVMALGSGNPAAGAVIMFMFTLGTVPLFFALSLAATTLGGRAQRHFNLVVAILIAVIAVLAIRGGMALTGHHWGGSSGAATAIQTTQTGNSQMVEIVAGKDGYAPASVTATAGAPVTLMFKTADSNACTATLAIPALKIERTLTTTGPTNVEIPAQKAGTKIGWTCGMGMYHGSVSFTGADASRHAAPATATTRTTPAARSAASHGVLKIDVRADGYSPSSLTAPANSKVALLLTTKDNASCTRTFVIPALKIERALPESGQTNVQLPPQPAGRRISFTCGMGMYTGWITFADSNMR